MTYRLHPPPSFFPQQTTRSLIPGTLPRTGASANGLSECLCGWRPQDLRVSDLAALTYRSSGSPYHLP
jgi:hypothetical protein